MNEIAGFVGWQYWTDTTDTKNQGGLPLFKSSQEKPTELDTEEYSLARKNGHLLLTVINTLRSETFSERKSGVHVVFKLVFSELSESKINDRSCFTL